MQRICVSVLEMGKCLEYGRTRQRLSQYIQQSNLPGLDIVEKLGMSRRENRGLGCWAALFAIIFSSLVAIRSCLQIISCIEDILSYKNIIFNLAKLSEYHTIKIDSFFPSRVMAEMWNVFVSVVSTQHSITRNIAIKFSATFMGTRKYRLRFANLTSVVA